MRGQDKRKTVLIVLPSLERRGGVAHFFRVVLPHIDNYHLFELPESRNGVERALNFLLNQIKFSRKVREEWKLIHVNPSLDFLSFIRDGLFIWQAKRKKKPVLVFFRGWNSDFAEMVSRALYFFFERTYAKADCFLVLARDFKRTLTRWGIDSEKVNLFTTAFDYRMIQNFDINQKIRRIRDSDVLKVLFLARLERNKGVFETIEAVDLLLTNNLQVELLIAGEGSVFDEVKNLVSSKSNLKKRVRVLGFVEGKDKVQAFEESHIYCIPTSHGEGMPNSLLEAMAFGLAVITRPVGGIKDFFEDGNMGFTIKSNDPVEVASSIAKLLEDRERLIKIAKYNHAYAEKHFSSLHVAAKIAELYGKVILGHPEQ